MILSKQAQNSMALYKGQPISSIVSGLKMQPRVAEEFKNHFGAESLEEVAVRLH